MTKTTSIPGSLAKLPSVGAFSRPGDALDIGRALNELPAGAVPDWIELLPAAETVAGADGRQWLNDQPQSVAAAFGRPLPVDWEHASELAAPLGKEAPAAGWIEELQARDGGSIWGRVEWTERAKAQIQAREYRFISPVFDYERATLRIRRIVSAGLTNSPNLSLRALNRAQLLDHANQPGETGMSNRVTKSLGLIDGANDDQIVAAIDKLKGDFETAKNRAETPDINHFMPKADYDAVLARATNAEAKLKETEDGALKAEAEAVIDAALKDGKIVPASLDYYRATCRDRTGLDAFKAFAASAPKVVADSGLDGKTPSNSGGTLTNEERAVCRQLGLTDEQFAKARA